MADGVLSYKDFKCELCGICCKRQKIVLLTIYDIFRLSENLGLKPEMFYKKYCMRSDKFDEEARTRLFLKAEGGCPFLKGNTCSIHEFKPIVCSQSPFYFVESSLAAYKVFNIIQDDCSISKLPYSTITEGDPDKLADMEILVNITDEYMEKYGRFDERAAAGYYEMSKNALKDEKLRSSTKALLLDRAIKREDACRNEPYYKGSMKMYLSGFYKVHVERIKKEILESNGRAVFTFQPSALGIIDGMIGVVLFDEDYKVVKRALEGKDGGNIIVEPFEFEEMSYATVKILQARDKPIIFYYFIESKALSGLRSPDNDIRIKFVDGKGRGFIYKGHDINRWLSQD
jgi:Fe-S-cluster containining protein